MTDFDYAIIGGGASGLSLLEEMIEQGLTRSHKVLLLEKRTKYEKDKVWSFWNVYNFDATGYFFKQWNDVEVSNKRSVVVDCADFQYTSIDSVKFYDEILSLGKSDPNVTIHLDSPVDKIEPYDDYVIISSNGTNYSASYVFNSIPDIDLTLGPYDLLQHFKGWEIEFDAEIFQENLVTLMDFKVDQSLGLHFFYILPETTNSALVEATWFSKKVLSDEEYERRLTEYIEELAPAKTYKIKYVEKGIIPMFSRSFQSKSHLRVLNIGTIGGLARPSTGYAFLAIRRFSKALVANLMNGKVRIPKIRSRRTLFMDRVLLKILSIKPEYGPLIFEELFARCRTRSIVNFLSDTSSLRQEFEILVKVPYRWSFVKMALLTALPWPFSR